MTELANDMLTRPPIRIVHLGIGAFYRAFALAYIEKLNEQTDRFEDRYGVMGVSFRSPSVRDALAQNDFVYSALERGGDGDICHAITSLVDVAFAGEERARILDQMAAPAVSIISLTITEKGYCAHDGTLDLAHPDIVHDIANPENPVSAPGYIVAALAMRRAAGIAPFTCLSCDNLSDNGQLLGKVVTALAARSDPDLGDWIAAEVRFPITMVDRIVPATTDADRADIARITGHDEGAPVVHEPFSQWVIEDSFGPLGFPDMASVGVQIVADVAPFEGMKLRCLNGSHTALAILGSLHGKETVSAAIDDPALSGFIAAFWQHDICPSIVVPLGVDIADYCNALLVRYRNPAIVHRTAQIAADTSKKLSPRILAPLADNLAHNRPISRLCLVIAGWMRFIRLAHMKGEIINDPLASQFGDIMRRTVDGSDYVMAMLGLEAVFDDKIAQHDKFVTAVAQWYRRISEDGVEACLIMAARGGEE